MSKATIQFVLAGVFLGLLVSGFVLDISKFWIAFDAFFLSSCLHWGFSDLVEGDA